MKSTLLAVGFCSLALSAQAALTWDVTADYSVNNPNGPWQYGTEDASFDNFTRMPYNDLVSGYGNSVFHLIVGVASIVQNLTGNSMYGIPNGWVSLQPKPDGPTVIRWTAPAGLSGDASINGQFLAGDSGIMQVAVRFNNNQIWNASDAGSFNLTETIQPGNTIDFLVYGGYGWGNTPLSAKIEVTPVPEPSNYVAGVSALAMLYFGWRNRK